MNQLKYRDLIAVDFKVEYPKNCCMVEEKVELLLEEVPDLRVSKDPLFEPAKEDSQPNT